MIKEIAWDTFKNTGDINTFLEYKQIQNLEKGIQEIAKLPQPISYLAKLQLRY